LFSFERLFRILWVASLLTFVSPSVHAEAITTGTITVPGGFAPVARILGVKGTPPPSVAIQRLFSVLVQAEVPLGAASPVNPVREDLLSYFKEYDRFVRYLEKEGLLPDDGAVTDTIVFRFEGTAEEIERTKKLLSYFDVQSLTQGNGSSFLLSIEDASGTERKAQLRILIEALDLNFHDRNPGTIHIESATRLPLLFDEAAWSAIVPGKKSDALFERFLKHPEAMRLYLALSNCSQEAARALIETVEPAKLLESSEILHLAGSDLQFENGVLLFPGDRKSWISLLKAGPESAAPIDALLRHQGMPLLFYSSVAAAPLEVQEYMTASPQRLKSYYEVLKAYDDGRCCGTTVTAVAQDFPRILKLLKADSSGLVPVLDDRIARPLLHQLVQEELAEDKPGPVIITPKVLGKLLPRPGISPYAETSRAGTLEFFKYVGETWLNGFSLDSIKALVQNPKEAPVYIDLIGDLSPDPELLATYLAYCHRIAEHGAKGWNLNRTRTSQSIFFLLSALRREGAISSQGANALLHAALQALDSDREAVAATAVAGFLSDRLLPELRKTAEETQDFLLSALSGRQSELRIVHRGKEVAFDYNAARFQRMHETLQSQSYTPLNVLIEIYRLLKEIGSLQSGSPATEEMIEALSARLSEIRTTEKTPAGDDVKVAPKPIRIEEVKKKLRNADDPAEISGTIAARLHGELGITLMTYCYAYAGMPEIDVLAFDPNFVRKHRFFPESGRKAAWNSARFVQDDSVGGLMEGSLSGLEMELTRLHSAQSDQSLSAASNPELVLAIRYGIRQMRPALRTDRSQEYVALATKLGAELISEISAGPAADWVRKSLPSLVSPGRLEQVRQHLVETDADAAVEVLSRSELFLLGRAFCNSPEADSCRSGPDSGGFCDLVNRIRRIVPAPGSVEYRRFNEEVNQYGVSLHSRIGLSRLSFDLVESYERLEKSLHPQTLYDRLCDLKIRIAEINYDMELPASLGEIQAGIALKSMLSTRTIAGWQETVRQTNRLSKKMAPVWIDELMKNKYLVPEILYSRNPHQ